MKEIVLLIVLYLLLSSGSFLGASFGKRYEKCIPLTVSLIIIVLYIFSLFGRLRIGVNASGGLCLLAYIVFTIRLVKTHDLKLFFNSFATPGWLVFTVLYFTLAILNHGKMAAGWDEFSHWMLCVKEMFFLDDLTTNPISIDSFRSYPPAMSLFQYFVIRLRDSIGFDESFLEWKAYFAYQMLGISYLVYFLRKTKWKKLFLWVPFLVGVFIIPTIFFEWYYGSIYVDAIVGICIGCGFAGIITDSESEIGNSCLYTCFICMVLPLLKDVGFIFSLFIALCFALAYFCNRKLYVCYPLLASLLSKLSWKVKLSIENVDVAFGGRIDFVHYIRMLIIGDDDTYRQIAVTNALREFVFGKAHVSGADSKYLTNLGLVVILLLISLLVIIVFRNKRACNSLALRLSLLIPVGSLILYALFIGAIYAYRFSEYEAANLPSYNRYMGIPLLGCSVTVFVTLIYLLSIRNDNTIKGYLSLFSVILILLVLVPYEHLILFFRGYYKSASVYQRWEYTQLKELILEYTDFDDKVCFVSTDDDSVWDYQLESYECVPRRIDYVSGDCLSTEDYLNELMNYDYVAILNVNEDYISEYNEIFDISPTILSLYKVDKDAECCTLEGTK